MSKNVKINTPMVSNEKPQVKSANVDIPFDPPCFVSISPLNHVVVKLNISDGSTFERHFDFIPDCPIDKYVQIAIGIFNQYYAQTNPSK